ncbi:MAG: isochorismatase family protein [Bryobacteraceae bacterium]
MLRAFPAFREWRHLVALALISAATALGADLQLPVRSRVEAFKGSGVWEEVRLQEDVPIQQTAILICDMWDKHWCSGATRRVEALAGRMAPVIERARARGIQIIHAPSETMAFYQGWPQRQRMLRVAKVEPPAPLGLLDPPLPIDDTAGGCDTAGDQFYTAWKREIAAISMGDADVISDDGVQIYSFLRERGIRNLLVMGVHVNMCVLNRSFAIKKMTNWGIRCVLVRDLTDSMYNPKARPYVSHERGTELVVEHIEKYWCPSMLSTDLINALKIVAHASARCGAPGIAESPRTEPHSSTF